MKNKSNRARKAIIAVSISVIAICAVVIAVSLLSIYSPTGNTAEPTGSPSYNAEGVLPTEDVGEDASDSAVALSSLRIDVSESEMLVELIALLETKNVYDGTPSYVFVARKVPGANEDVTDEGAVEDTLEVKAQQYLAAYNDLLSFVREAADNWSIPYEEYASYLSKCTCIQTDSYIFVCGDERYQQLAEVFEQATNDPTVLDMEDLLARLTEFKIEG